MKCLDCINKDQQIKRLKKIIGNAKYFVKHSMRLDDIESRLERLKQILRGKP